MPSKVILILSDLLASFCIFLCYAKFSFRDLCVLCGRGFRAFHHGDHGGHRGRKSRIHSKELIGFVLHFLSITPPTDRRAIPPRPAHGAARRSFLPASRPAERWDRRFRTDPP